jgi:hypothetical protein
LEIIPSLSTSSPALAGDLSASTSATASEKKFDLTSVSKTGGVNDSAKPAVVSCVGFYNSFLLCLNYFIHYK